MPEGVGQAPERGEGEAVIGIENVETAASAMQSALTGLLGALECLRDKEYP